MNKQQLEEKIYYICRLRKECLAERRECYHATPHLPHGGCKIPCPRMQEHE